MEKNFNFKIFNKLEEKLEQDWKSLENDVEQFFFQKFVFIKTLLRFLTIQKLTSLLCMKTINL